MYIRLNSFQRATVFYLIDVKEVLEPKTQPLSTRKHFENEVDYKDISAACCFE